MNLLLPEEATNFKARSIALASTLKIELVQLSMMLLIKIYDNKCFLHYLSFPVLNQ
jgi:hypothetical protein